MMLIRQYNRELKLVDQFTVPKPWLLSAALTIVLKDAEEYGGVYLSAFSIYLDIVLRARNGKGNYFTDHQGWRWFEDSLVEELHKRHYTVWL